MGASLKLAVVALAIAGVAGISCFQIQRLRASRPRVWTEVVRARDVLTTITATGSARRGRETTLSSPDDGRVRAVLVTRGQLVRKGQIVAVLDDRPMRLAFERARGGVAIAEADVRRAEADVDRLRAERELSRLAHRRTEQLFAAGTSTDEALARSRYEARRADLVHAAGVEAVEAARARMRHAAADRLDTGLRLARRAIRAPADGVVIDTFAQPGQPVHGGSSHVPPSRLLTIGTALVTDIEVPMDSDEAARLRRGARAAVDIAALGMQGLDGHVASIVDSGRREEAWDVTIVRVRLEAPPPGLRTGMSALVHLRAASQPHLLAVPNHAVAGGEPGGAGVWTVRDGVVALVPIVLGLRGDFYSEVLAGVSPGMRVVTGPAAVIETLGMGDRAVAVPAPIRAP